MFLLFAFKRIIINHKDEVIVPRVNYKNVPFQKGRDPGKYIKVRSYKDILIYSLLQHSMKQKPYGVGAVSELGIA